MRIFFALFFLLPVAAFSQTDLFLNLSAGSYAMGDFRELQQQYAQSGYAVKKSLGNGGLLFDVELSHTDEIRHYGIYVLHNRITGINSNTSFEEKWTLSRTMIGFLYDQSIGGNFYVGGKMGFGLTPIRIDGASNSANVEGNFESFSFMLQPNICYLKQANGVTFKFDVGYELSVNGQASGGSSGGTLTNQQYKPIKPNWSGFRAGLGIGFRLSNKRQPVRTL